MLVRFKDNLGSNDAARVGLGDHSKCTKGATLSVSDEIGAKLVRLKLATEEEEPKPIKAVPAPPAIAEAKHEPKPAPLSGRINPKQ